MSNRRSRPASAGPSVLRSQSSNKISRSAREPMVDETLFGSRRNTFTPKKIESRLFQKSNNYQNTISSEKFSLPIVISSSQYRDIKKKSSIKTTEEIEEETYLKQCDDERMRVYI